MLRRALLAGAGALAAAPILSAAQTPADKAYGDLPPLKTLAPYPLGVAVKASQINDPAWARLATTQFSRLSPEWEMKMEYVLGDDGALRLDRADRMVAFARRNGMAVHGHTLIWYAQDGAWFQKLQNRPDAFLNAYVAYIQGVMGRYRGQIGAWDVVNEPVWNDGRGLRPCLWQKVLGDDYIGLALTAAHQADPGAVLFLNDYNLELTAAKRSRFLKLCESLLKSGAPLHGIGTQTHISADLPPGAITDAIRDIASLGLKVHISELDISLREDRPVNLVQPRVDQIKLFDTLLRAYTDIPSAQRYGLTLWALRDSDSWLNAPQERKGLLPDEPVLFDSLGRPKPLAHTLLDRHLAS